ncbi:HTH domain-containing protein [Streptomyces sp. NPDC005774]|uniref:helix-turn-helix domain-containing protein n=1 Tax=Streptomyces sp. NPDC005774 TaxID=3364728 RepID=UPI0036A0ECB1
MTPATARDLRRARVAQLRQAEPELSHRDMAQKLGISKDTVRRDLEAIEEGAAQSAPSPGRAGASGADMMAQTAPQVSTPETAEAAPPDEDPAPGVAQPAPLPRRVAEPLAGIDVSQWRALRRDLAILAQTDQQAEALVHQAVTAFAYAYKQALALGELEAGRPVLITGMTLRPAAQLADRPAS